MGKEDLRHRAARTTSDLVANIQARMDVARQARTLAHETGHVSIDATPQDQEIVLFERECLDTRAFSHDIAKYNDVYNQSVSTTEDSRLRID